MIFEMITVTLVLKLMRTFSLLSGVFIVVSIMGNDSDSPFCERSLALSSACAILAILLTIVYFWMI